MKNTLRILILLINVIIFSAYADSVKCTVNNLPKLNHPIANWDIIATNTATIPAADAFSGADLNFTVMAKAKKANNVKINAKTGQITIKAETKDNFDVKVVAKNNCGTATTTFNVQIDEEE